MVLVGPSGCGKSTTLRMLAGLEEVNEGKIFIGDRDITHMPPKDRDIAMVFQNYALYPHMTRRRQHGLRAEDGQGRRPTSAGSGSRRRPGSSVSTDYLERKPKALSGGQRQRVAMGRAIVRKPQVFCMDEPLSNLDAKMRVADPHRHRQAPGRPRGHHGLRHPRPGRGDDDGRPGGGDEAG